MEVFTFVVRDGCVIDLPHYIRAFRDNGMGHEKIEKLRIRLAQVSGTRRAIVEVSHGDYVLSLRPLAARPEEIVVDSAGVTDMRTTPTHRGPDLGWQYGIMARLTTDDGMLIDDSGAVISAILDPFMLIHNGAAHVSAHPRTTRSIALDGVVDILKEQGVDIIAEPEGFTRDQLMNNETWVVTSLYGARLVTGWLEYGGVVPARTGVERMGVPTHREVNQLRQERWVHA